MFREGDHFHYSLRKTLDFMINNIVNAQGYSFKWVILFVWVYGKIPNFILMFSMQIDGDYMPTSINLVILEP